MATLASGIRSEIERERSFFLKLALAMAFVLVAGFSFNVAAGRSTFAAPLLLHVHALVFFGWLVLFVTQSFLAASGSVRLHRRLGVLALLWVPVMVVLGLAVTRHSVRAIGGPPFFDTNEFLFGNSIGLLAFALTVGAALVMRARPDWHRRLMCGAMAGLTGPGFGRLLPMPFLIPWGWWVAAVVAPMMFILVGMVWDWRRKGRIHAAWLWGAGILIGSQLMADAIAYSPMGLAITRDMVAGTPGAMRDMRAFFP
ncbi:MULTISPECIES: hypothetical protein [unclassified Sphingobium]|uniref:hypothetical protein n=1 Tax=unclassified Sphingobium TaxID=2611147 RepID=UPI002224B060|nr:MULTISPECIES: hypothetical protein [unclassified Sphingobium]MCW2350966.1 hypothetical protein [Sphingobium sp. B12D2B]MCW2381227.1 hypothetical protein [Sphingobium sp. B2D3B]MCW2398666.1 hypothetical protein [Sphingobium sp. B2D3C]